MHFLVQKLRLGEDVLADAQECMVRRLPRANNSQILHQVTVQVPDCGLERCGERIGVQPGRCQDLRHSLGNPPPSHVKL